MLEDVEAGAVCVTQRFGARLNLNVHHHGIFPDGVFVGVGKGGMRFEPLAKPAREDVETVLVEVMQSEKAFVEAGKPARGLSAFIEGYSLEAGPHVHAGDRQGLER